MIIDMLWSYYLSLKNKTVARQSLIRWEIVIFLNINLAPIMCLVLG